MSSFSDLNLNVTNLSQKSIDDLVEYAIRLGYDNLGLSIDYEFPPIASKKSQDESSNVKGGNKNKKEARPQVTIPKVTDYKLPSRLEKRLKSCSRKINLFSRINIRIKPEDINVYLHHLKSKNIQSYDLIALEPSDNQALTYICTNNFNADIITINSGVECGLTDKHLIRALRNAVNSFSLCFELNYSSALSSSTERRDLIMAGRCLAFNSKLNGLIISSRASQPINLRGPYEILNMVQLFDITQQQAHKLVRDCAQNVIMNSFCRKHTAIGMVYFNDLKDLKKLETHLMAYKRKLSENITESNVDQKEDTSAIEVDESSDPLNKKVKF